MPDAKIIDLGDFIPAEYEIRFAINGRKYHFQLAEATVDEVLRMMMENKEEDQDIMGKMRRVVNDFLVQHAQEADREQLKADLATIPYKSPSGQLDIITLYGAIQQKYEKKDLGAESPPAKKA